MSFTVFYLEPRATDDVLAMVREQMPAGWRLLSPSHPTEFAREPLLNVVPESEGRTHR